MWFSSTPNLNIWPPDLSFPPLRMTDVETVPAFGIEKIGTPINDASTETTPYKQPTVSPSLYVSRAVLLSCIDDWLTGTAPSLRFNGHDGPISKSRL